MRTALCALCGRLCERMAGRLACVATLAMTATSLGVAERAQAQSRVTTSAALPIENAASVVIGAVFRLEPSQAVLQESGPPSDRCSPLTCFRGTVLLRSNSRWQLEARLDPTLVFAAPVSWFPTNAPEQLLTSEWQVIRTSPIPAAALSLDVRLAVGGPTSQRPNAAQLSSVFQLRVVALP